MTEEILNMIRPIASQMFERAVLPDRESLKESQRQVFFREVEGLNFCKDEDGEIVLKDERGFILTDAHGWNLTPKEAISQVFTKYFEKCDLPETLLELDKRLKDPNITPKERIRLTEYWLKKHPDSQ